MKVAAHLRSLGVEGVDKPLVVLVPDAMSWVLGEWALEMAADNADDFDFVIFPLAELRTRTQTFSELMEFADIVHCLTQSSYAEVERCILKSGSHPPKTVSSIHHIVCFEDVEACLSADRIHVMCESVSGELLERGVPEEKLHLVRKQIDVELLRRHDRSEARKQLGLPETGFTIGFSAKAVSDDRGRKGMDVLWRALAELKAGPEDPVRLVLTGPGWGEKLASISIPGVEIQHFPFLARGAMSQFYSAIDVYLSPARIEGGPVPPFEAMSCETPVVCTQIGMAADLITDGVDGLLVPVDDAVATATALERIRRDPEWGTTIGRAGRMLVERELVPPGGASSSTGLYSSLTLQPRRASGKGPTLAELTCLSDELVASDTERWNQNLRCADTQAPRTAYRRLRSVIRRVLDAGQSTPFETVHVAHVDLERLKTDRDSRVLDLGCGTGQFTIPMLEQGYQSICADLDAPRLRQVLDACRPKGLDSAATRADAAMLPFRSGCFDSVVCREMIEHIDEPGAVIDEIWRILEPEGMLCVTVPSAHTERYFQCVDSRWLEMAGHVNVFTRKSMCELLEGHGFKVVEVRGRNCYYAFFWFLHTLVGTTHDGTGRIQDHFRLARWIAHVWRLLGEGYLKRAIERVGNLLIPKSYVYYCERVDSD